MAEAQTINIIPYVTTIGRLSMKIKYVNTEYHEVIMKVAEDPKHKNNTVSTENKITQISTLRPSRLPAQTSHHPAEEAEHRHRH